jgi:hypothetical protein
VRKIVLGLFLFLIITSVTYAQEIIENPKRPLSKNAGRTLKLVEELRITDKPGIFYFRSPDDLKITKDGHIYISDPNGNNFIKFSPNGQFLKNLYKKGEGPGEIQDFFGYALSLNHIYICDYVKRKIIVIDHEGKLLSEFKLETELYNSGFLGIYKDWLVFMKDVWPPGIDRKTSRLYEIKRKVIRLSKDGKTSEENNIFSNKIFLIASSLGGGAMPWDPFDSVLDDNSGYLYVSCTREYMIHIFDLNKGEAIRSFKRKYKRVRHEMSQREENFIKKYNSPRKKYKMDIERLHLYKGLLWVETSTKDEKRGIMIDVFNSKGQFLDNFYLALDGNLMSVQDKFLFVLKSDKEGNYIIKKCVIEDEN